MVLVMKSNIDGTIEFYLEMIEEDDELNIIFDRDLVLKLLE